MNTSEIKIQLFREIDNLAEDSLLELRGLVLSFISHKQIVKPKRKRIFGSMKGAVKYMSPDFNEPLSEFNDYM